MRFLSLLIAGATAICLASTAAAEDRTLAPARLSSLSVSGGVRVEAIAGPVRSVTLSGEAEELSHTRLRETKTGVEVERRCTFGCNSRRNKLTLRVVSPDLSELVLAQGVDATVTGVSAPDFKLVAKQGVELTVTGQCQSLIIDGAMGVSLDASGLQCQTALVKGAMGADIDFFASEKADVSASMGASVRIRGGAKDVTSKASLGGSIERD